MADPISIPCSHVDFAQVLGHHRRQRHSKLPFTSRGKMDLSVVAGGGPTIGTLTGGLFLNLDIAVGQMWLDELFVSRPSTVLVAVHQNITVALAKQSTDHLHRSS